MNTASNKEHKRRVNAFARKAIGDLSGAYTCIMAGIGDHLGLFKNLASNGPATSAELASRMILNERYLREWLGGMMSAGYLEFDTHTRRYQLPAHHVPILAQEGGEFFLGGGFQDFLSKTDTLYDMLLKAFEYGGGVPQSAFKPQTYEAMARMTAAWFHNSLLSVWIPSMPDVHSKLQNGARTADIGCGRGLAVIKMAQSFPAARFVGYDLFEPIIVEAEKQAMSAGVADRVQFRHLNASCGLPEQYDVITTFDVLHDAADPLGLLKSIRRALKPGGKYVCLDTNCSEKTEENVGPIATLLYGASLTYCLTTSLAQNGAGLGSLGLTESTLRLLAKEAGFKNVTRIPIQNDLNNLYELSG